MELLLGLLVIWWLRDALVYVVPLLLLVVYGDMLWWGLWHPLVILSYVPWWVYVLLALPFLVVWEIVLEGQDRERASQCTPPCPTPPVPDALSQFAEDAQRALRA